MKFNSNIYKIALILVAGVSQQSDGQVLVNFSESAELKPSEPSNPLNDIRELDISKLDYDSLIPFEDGGRDLIQGAIEVVDRRKSVAEAFSPRKRIKPYSFDSGGNSIRDSIISLNKTDLEKISNSNFDIIEQVNEAMVKPDRNISYAIRGRNLIIVKIAYASERLDGTVDIYRNYLVLNREKQILFNYKYFKNWGKGVETRQVTWSEGDQLFTTLNAITFE